MPKNKPYYYLGESLGIEGTILSCYHLVHQRRYMYNTKINLLNIFTQQIWRLYCDSCAMNGDKAAAYQSFSKYWLQLQPNIRIGKPMSDLCWTCQQNSTMIAQSINKSEEEKSEVNCIHFSTTMSRQFFGNNTEPQLQSYNVPYNWNIWAGKFCDTLVVHPNLTCQI